MRRALAAVVPALLIFAVGVSAEEVRGKLKAIDVDKGIIVLAVKDKNGEKDREFRITKDTVVQNPAGNQITGGVRAVSLEKGPAPITITLDAKGVVTAMRVGPGVEIKPVPANPPKPVPLPIPIQPIPLPMPIRPIPIQPVPPVKPMPPLKETPGISGKLKSVDAGKGLIVVTVGNKDEQFVVREETRILDAAGLEFKNGLKSKIFQKPAGLPVTIMTEKDGKGKELVTEVRVGPLVEVGPRPIKPGTGPIQFKPIPPIQPIPPIKPFPGLPGTFPPPPNP